MKKHIRLLTAILALIMILPSIVSCAETKSTDVVTTAPEAATEAPSAETTVVIEETTQYEPDDLDEKYNFDEVVTFFIWSDHRMKEFFSEDGGNTIDHAIYNRNIKVSERLGITIDFVQEKGSLDFYKEWNKKAENDWNSDNAYDIYAGYSRAVPLLAINGMTANMLEYDTFSVEKPWWPEALTTECTIKDKLLFCTGDIATSLLWYMDAVLYNKELYNAYYNGQQTPMDMVDANEWTFEKLNEMCETVAKDVNQDGVYDENDNYGCFARWDFMMCQENTTGYQYTKIEEDGSIKVTGLTEDLLTIHSKLYPFMNNNNAYWSGYTFGVHASYQQARPFDNAGKAMFCNDQILFSFADMGWTGSQQLRDFGAYGILPSPKYLETQENYGTQTSSYSAGISVSTTDFDRACIILEALEAESYKIVRPAYFDTALSYKYLNDPQAVEMLDLIFASMTCEWSYNYANAGIGNTLGRALVTTENLASFFAQNEAAINEKLATFVEQVEAIPEYIPA